MKKTIAAVTAGLLLVAGQAAAASGSSPSRVADRIGAASGDSSEFTSESMPILVALAGAAILIVAATNDDSESD